mmetsp:Transcript_45799/g.143277  ORF Transcript_45799/g.143277 Transcript_45799/m.143277 type:complete len:177 (-) Transcript_45799:140-670(-)
MGDFHAALVFSCRTCGTIVGDSLGIAAMDGAAKRLSLVGAVNVDVAARGAAAVTCSGCSRRLGRKRRFYELDTDQIQSYELGSAGVASGVAEGGNDELMGPLPPPSPQPEQQQQQEPPSPPQGAAGASAADTVKMKNVMLHFHERLCTLEDAGVMERLAALEREVAALRRRSPAGP